MTITIISLVLSLLATMFAGITAYFSIKAYAKVVGLENSTHKVQFVPIDEKGKTGDDLIKSFSETFDLNGENDHV